MSEEMIADQAAIEIGHFLLDLEIDADQAILSHLHLVVAVMVVGRLQELLGIQEIQKFYRLTQAWWALS